MRRIGRMRLIGLLRNQDRCRNPPSFPRKRESRGRNVIGTTGTRQDPQMEILLVAPAVTPSLNRTNLVVEIWTTPRESRTRHAAPVSETQKHHA